MEPFRSRLLGHFSHTRQTRFPYTSKIKFPHLVKSGFRPGKLYQMSSTPLALILDDRPSRHRYIQKELGQAYQIICCFEPQEAIDLLLENSLVFSFVSLDFQLGHPTMDGLSVVLALKNAAQNPDVLAKLQKAKWRVHSMDYEGGPNMVHTLREFLGNGFVQDHFPLP